MFQCEKKKHLPFQMYVDVPALSSHIFLEEQTVGHPKFSLKFNRIR